MTKPASTSLLVAKDFLQTVVIVDDQADLGMDASGSATTLGTLKASSSADASERSPDFEVDQDAAPAQGAPTSGLLVPSDDALSVAQHGDLDAKTIINDFAHLGLVCGVIRPERDEDIGPVVEPAARRADILVLDWWMYGDGGETSKSIISQLARMEGQQDRIRLIIIYTAVQDLQNVAEEVASVLDGAEVVGDNHNRVIAGSIRLTVLAKPGTNVDPALAADVVPFEAFPDRVVSEFASAVEGVISNVAFAALSAIRDNTHRVLSRFDRSLDPAFLAHRMLLPNPGDSELHLVELILQEFSAVLESAGVGRNASYDAIHELVSNSILVVEDFEKLKTLAKRSSLSVPDLVMSFVRKGVSNPEFQLSRNEKKDIRGWISKIFALSSDQSVNPRTDTDEQWAMLMSCKLQYGKVCPELRLGVLVRDIESGRFLLCMQPACDSVRLMAHTAFPFLPLDDASGTADLTLKYADQYHMLNLRIKFRDLLLIPFEPSDDSGGAVRAQWVDTDEKWRFVPSSRELGALEWVGELRDAFAHKFAHMFAQSASRIGTNESELFRRG